MVEYDELHKDRVRRVRAIGESIMKNAESIAGSELHSSGLKIECSLDEFSADEISVTRNFYPERSEKPDTDIQEKPKKRFGFSL